MLYIIHTLAHKCRPYKYLSRPRTRTRDLCVVAEHAYLSATESVTMCFFFVDIESVRKVKIFVILTSSFNQNDEIRQVVWRNEIPVQCTYSLHVRRGMKSFKLGVKRYLVVRQRGGVYGSELH